MTDDELRAAMEQGDSGWFVVTDDTTVPGEKRMPAGGWPVTRLVLVAGRHVQMALLGDRRFGTAEDAQAWCDAANAVGLPPLPGGAT